VKQAKRHLEIDPAAVHFSGPIKFVDFYDHSSGHQAFPKDALLITKINKQCGHSRRDEINIRDGWFQRNGAVINQTFHFIPGGTVLFPIKEGWTLCKDRKAIGDIPTGYVVQMQDQLIGVLKGAIQILLEREINVDNPRGQCQKQSYRNNANKRRKVVTDAYKANPTDDNIVEMLTLPLSEDINAEVAGIICNCPKCVLQAQSDFSTQPCALQEAYDSFNQQHGTSHECHFLPMFHPELNPIERCWSMLKRFCRENCDGRMESLRECFQTGLSSAILTPQFVRRAFRMTEAYLIAYKANNDVLQAEHWIRQHRSHRRHSPRLDDSLLATEDREMQDLYYPEQDIASDSRQEETSER